MAKSTILLTELMKSNIFNHIGMLALLFCFLLIQGCLQSHKKKVMKFNYFYFALRS